MPLQPCCRPWQWGPHGGPSFRTFKNSYYLSDPGMYAKHASNVIQEDSMITIDDADQVIVTFVKAIGREVIPRYFFFLGDVCMGAHKKFNGWMGDKT